MAKVNKEINFVINVAYAAQKQMKSFTDDIDRISLAVQQIDKIGGRTGADNIALAQDALSGFVKELSELTTKNFYQGFENLATSLRDIRLATQSASGSMQELHGMFSIMGKIGDLFEGKIGSIFRATVALREFAKQVRLIGRIEDDKLEAITLLFDRIALALGKLGSGSVLPQIMTTIGSQATQLSSVADAIERIAKALTLEGVRQTAESISRIGPNFPKGVLSGAPVAGGGAGTPVVGIGPAAQAPVTTGGGMGETGTFAYDKYADWGAASPAGSKVLDSIFSGLQ